MKKNITVLDVAKNPITLIWDKQIATLRKFAAMQMGIINQTRSLSDDQFMWFLQIVMQQRLNRIQHHIPIENCTTILDIGSGVGLLDLILLQKYNTQVYLLDKNLMSRIDNSIYHSENHGFYNSWDAVEDCIIASNLDKNKIRLLDTDDNWPLNLDLVISTYSWCWHYPKEVYWNKVVKHLKFGGFLALDVLFLKNKNVVEEISEEFRSTPKLVTTTNINSPHCSVFDRTQFAVNADGAIGGFYIWTKNK